MILPHKLTFFDLISYKVKNRSGDMLFTFERRKVIKNIFILILFRLI